MRLVFLLLTLLSIPFLSEAATFQSGDTVDVSSEGNVYAAGSVIEVREEVKGDVYLLGETVHIDNTVLEDVFAIGQNVTIKGAVEDDLHTAGATVFLSSRIAGDAMVFGQKIVLAPETHVSGASYLAGQELTIDGFFEGPVRLLGTDVKLNGTYEGDVTINVGTRLTFGEATSIKGNLLYSAPEELIVNVPEGAVFGEVIEKRITNAERGSLIPGHIRLASLLSRLLLGSMIIAFARMFALNFGSRVREDYWKMLGVGFLGLVVPPLAAIFLLIPVLTIPLSVLTFLAWGSLLYFASLLSGLIVAHFLFPLRREETLWMHLGKFALGTILLLLFVRLVPFFGTIVSLIITLLSIAALLHYYRSAYVALRQSGVT